MLPFVIVIHVFIFADKHVSSVIPSDEANLNDGYATSIFKTGLGRSILATENTRERTQFVLEAKEAVKQGEFVF